MSTPNNEFIGTQRGYFYEGVTYYEIDDKTCYFTFDSIPIKDDKGFDARNTLIVHKYVYFIDHCEREVVRSKIETDDPIPMDLDTTIKQGKANMTIILPDDVKVYSSMFDANIHWEDNPIAHLYIPAGVVYDTLSSSHTYEPYVNNLYLSTCSNFGASIFYAIELSKTAKLTIFGSDFDVCGICYKVISEYIKSPAVIYNYSSISNTAFSTLFSCSSIKNDFVSNTFEIISKSKSQ